MIRTRLSWLTAAALLTTAGCTKMNESIDLLDTQPLAALTMDRQSVLSGEPSVSGQDRRDWEQETVRVVLHQTETNPRMSTDIYLHKDTPRQQGDYPDATNVVVTEETGLSYVGEGAINAGGFVIGLVSEPIKLLMKGQNPWSVTREYPQQFQTVPTGQVVGYDSRWVTDPSQRNEEAQP